MMKELEFEKLYKDFVESLFYLEGDNEDVINIEEENDSGITFSICDVGEYIVSKHSSSKEIWMVSPKTGPYHFKYLGEWIDNRGIKLWDLIMKEALLKKKA